jgi:hypothetical protein
MSGRFRLLQGQSEEALTDMARRTVAPLIDYDARRHARLVETLRTWLDHHWAVQPTAEALFIHRNTLQKRLRRIETLLGVDLQDPDDIMELYLGLRATQLLGEEAVVGRPPKGSLSLRSSLLPRAADPCLSLTALQASQHRSDGPPTGSAVAAAVLAAPLEALARSARETGAGWEAQSGTEAGSLAPCNSACNRAMEPALCNGSLRLPHLGLCTQLGQPLAQGQAAMRARASAARLSKAS